MARGHGHVRPAYGDEVDVSGWVAEKALTTRRVARAPIWLYRHGLGRAFGHRMLMLEHVGRRSGRPRFVCLEVLSRPSRDRLVVVSGFGTRSQWYQNLRARSECRVSIAGRRDVRANARFLSDEESAQVLREYQSAHPRAWRHLRHAIERAVDESVHSLPMVELTLDAST